MIDFYTVIIRKSAKYWVALCLENGLVGQGNTPEQSIDKLKQAIESFSEVYESESNIYLNPLAINELHEFLTLEDAEASDTYELRKVALLIYGMNDST
ncbi:MULTISPECIES: hypothetical protein [unclassified Microcoleus]|uniref:type II toxin-antitoxin system HicB family antitoxin n=1 Tax=unclassified Microcoleus TaxID=2642155 RepID=UPI0025FCE442|nr:MULTISPECIES: hypothetical protein [unclassified Microcoleus]